MTVLSIRTAIFGAACALLVGCSGGSSEHKVSDAGIVKGLLKKKPKATMPSAQQIAAAAQAALAATDQPLIMIALPNRKVVSVMQQIETNGPYATYGTSDRISMTMRHGVVTATRGLGDDLMSSHVNASLNLITKRQAGTVQRVQRFLDGENLTVTLETTCTITPGGSSAVEVEGSIRQTIAMTETCQAQTTKFQNSYQVDRNTGRILQSTQWIGRLNEHISIQVLR